MPKIIGQAEQQAAFKEISTLLRGLEKTNMFLTTPNRSGHYTISFAADDGSRCSATAFSLDKGAVDALILNNKHVVRQRVEELAEEHRIGLDLEDKAVLGMELTEEEAAELERRTLAAFDTGDQSEHKDNPDEHKDSNE